MEKEKTRLSEFQNLYNDRQVQVDGLDLNYGFTGERKAHKNYTPEEIRRVLDTRDPESLQNLSEDFFLQGGIYARHLIYYATLFTYQGLLVPSPRSGVKMTEKHIIKKYQRSLDIIENLHLPKFLQHAALTSLIYGCYYGVIKGSGTQFTIMDLPRKYCRTRFQDDLGNYVIEFNLTYFDTRRDTLSMYPDSIQQGYQQYKGRQRWMIIPPEEGVCFPFYNKIPFFISMLTDVLDYENSLTVEQERELEEIRKIIVLKMPHLNTGELVFEPQEAEIMHKGAVGMLGKNKNVSVLTTYTDVDSVVSKSTTDTGNTFLENMFNNIFNKSGTSTQLFAADNNLSLETSINNDMAFMQGALIDQFNIFLTNLINRECSNSNIHFKYTILPITYYNKSKYVEDSLKLANSGYSFLLPALAMGMNQKDLLHVKELENDVLHLEKYLIPLATSYTQSGNPAQPEENKGGAPEKDDSEKADDTARREEDRGKEGGTKE